MFNSIRPETPSKSSEGKLQSSQLSSSKSVPMKTNVSDEGDASCNKTVPHLLDVVATMKAANAELTAEISRLGLEVSRLSVVETPTTSESSFRGGGDAVLTGDGSGAGSPEAYQEITKRNWHGKLGRAHMVDVDRMSEAVKTELDCFLRRKLMALLPFEGDHVTPDSDTIFATLSAFGLRLEDRGPLADLKIANDGDLLKSPLIRRLQNFAAYYLTLGDFNRYWKGSALETLLELSRYRGIFDENGFVKVVN